MQNKAFSESDGNSSFVFLMKRPFKYKVAPSNYKIVLKYKSNRETKVLQQTMFDNYSYDMKTRIF